MLNTSARNSRFIRSVSRNVLPSMKSAFWSPGPRTGFLELFPMAYSPGAANPDLSNQADGLRPAKPFGFATRSGRCTAYPNADRLLVACVTGTASPDCTRTRPAISQPEIFQNRGIWYTQPAENTCGMSPLDTSRSRERLFASAAP